MLSLEAPMYRKLLVPNILVTPTFTSRDSLPGDMLSVLASIIGPDSASTVGTEGRRGNAVVSIAYGPMDDDPKDEDIGVPHTPSKSQAAPAENHFLLKLDIENPRFSFGDMLSDLGTSVGRKSPPIDDTATTSTTSGTRSNASSRCGSEYVVTDDVSSRLASAPEDLDACPDTGSNVLRRPVPEIGKCPPTWRHAMYVSSLVWPVQRGGSSEKGEDRPECRDKPLPPTARSGYGTRSLWRSGMDAFARIRTLGSKR